MCYINAIPLLHQSGLHKGKAELTKFVTASDHANIYAEHVILFALLA